MLISSLKQLLDASRFREKKLIIAFQQLGGKIEVLDLEVGSSTPNHETEQVNFFDKSTFLENFFSRSGWLIGLLIFQSGSSFILSSNETLIQTHPNIIYFLTMLVGAGGNAGNQAAVRVIREIAVGSLTRANRAAFVRKECLMAVALAAVIGLFGLLRVSVFASISRPEAVAISLALLCIVLISIVVGVLLPLLFQRIGLDPAHSSTTIQVIMDISGVLITCLVASALLDNPYAKNILAQLNIS
jgi:Mg/Co/Ni transporter MgtE